MSDILKEKEKQLELEKVEDEIQGYRTSRAEKKAMEKKMRAEYGRDWKKILGMAGKLMDSETKQSLYSINPQLRELTRPGKLRRL